MPAPSLKPYRPFARAVRPVKAATPAPHTGPMVKVGELHSGDRFIANGSLWTVLGKESAATVTVRRHGEHSLKLGSFGHGYSGDGLCSFPAEDIVRFQAPARP